MPNEPLNKFQSAVTRTTAAIGVKTSVFVGSAKIKTHISTLKSEISSMKLELGTTVYELWEKGGSNPDVITRQCQTINEKYKSIKELEAEVDKLASQEAEVLGSKKQEDSATSQNAKSFICTGCNTEFDAPMKFCRKCGVKMV